MASKTVFASAFAFIFHASSSSSRAAHHLGHPKIKIYTLYTFYTATKRGFAITSPVKRPRIRIHLMQLPNNIFQNGCLSIIAMSFQQNNLSYTGNIGCFDLVNNNILNRFHP